MAARQPRGVASDTPPAAGSARSQGRAASPAEMPAEHALLALIAQTGGEAHGYELARHFDPGSPSGLGEIFRLEQSMLYQHLKKLERRGWLTVSLRPQGARPPRQVYALTEAGRAELRRWLEEPVTHTREIRLEFLVKLYFALQLDRARASRLIAEQRDVCRGITASLESQAATFDAANAASGDREARFGRMVLDLRLEQTRAAAAWLDGLDTWARSPVSEAGP